MAKIQEALSFLDELIEAVEAQPKLGTDSYFDNDNGCACSLGAVMLKRAPQSEALTAAWDEYTNPDTSVSRRATIATGIEDLLGRNTMMEVSNANSRIAPQIGWIPSLNDGEEDVYNVYTVPPLPLESIETPVERKARVLASLRTLRTSLQESLAV